MRKLFAILALLSLATLLLAQETVVVVRHKAAAGGGAATYVGESHANPSGTATTVASSSATGTKTLNVAAGDLVIVLAASDGTADTPTGTIGSDALTTAQFTPLVADGYEVVVMYKENASANAAATCTVTFGATVRNYRAIACANYHGVLTSSALKNVSCAVAGCDERGASGVNRTAVNVTTTTANALLVAIGVDWDGAATHTAANSFVRRIGSGESGSTPFLLDKNVTQTGSYPNGNFSTVGGAQNYVPFFLVFGAQ